MKKIASKLGIKTSGSKKELQERIDQYNNELEEAIEVAKSYELDAEGTFDELMERIKDYEEDESDEKEKID